MMAARVEPGGGGFATGLSAAGALERPGDLLHAVFMTRTFGLFDKVPPEELAEYLSGLLIGPEMIAGAHDAKRAVVIGGAELAERYLRAAPPSASISFARRRRGDGRAGRKF